tara:strand:+ start:1119 stop:1337 length:219 start_codon:yes stop_codon:yes gene_type:complete
MSDEIRKYDGANYRVSCLGKESLFSKETEFSDLEEAIACQNEMQNAWPDKVIVNEVVIDRKGLFVGWKRLEK